MMCSKSFKCNICSNTEYVFHCTVHDDTSRNTGFVFDYVKCENCGTLSLFPLPTPEQTTFANETLLGIKRKNSSFDKRFTEEYKESLHAEYRKTFSDLNLDITSLPQAKCLDVGCAVGSLLDVLFEEGWQTYGCDVSQQLTSLIDTQKHSIHVGSLETLPPQWNSFDLITCIEVLEHLHDPVGMLRTIVSLLKPGGVLLTETPQVGILAEVYGTDWRVLAGLDHIHLMTKETQLTLLNDLGLTVESWITFGSGCTNGLTPPHIKKAFDALVKRQGIGDFLAIKARKPLQQV